jgi:hypothetical protein
VLSTLAELKIIGAVETFCPRGGARSRNKKEVERRDSRRIQEAFGKRICQANCQGEFMAHETYCKEQTIRI